MASERLGTTALGVMTEAFVDAAEAMAGALGDSAYGFAVIPSRKQRNGRGLRPGRKRPFISSAPSWASGREACKCHSTLPKGAITKRPLSRTPDKNSWS